MSNIVVVEELLAPVELAYARGVTELLDADPAADAAEHWLNVALAGARSNGMRLIELRAATSRRERSSARAVISRIADDLARAAVRS